MADETQDKKDNGAPNDGEVKKPVEVKRNADGTPETEQQRHARVGREDRAKAAESGFSHPGVDHTPSPDINMYAGTAIGREVGAQVQGTGTSFTDREPNIYPLGTADAASQFAPRFRNRVVDPNEVQGDTVRMFLPSPVLLTVAHGQQVRFSAGEQDVPLEYSTHYYLIAHGARPANKGEAEKIEAEKQRQAATREKEKINSKDKEADALQSKTKGK